LDSPRLTQLVEGTSAQKIVSEKSRLVGGSEQFEQMSFDVLGLKPIQVVLIVLAIENKYGIDFEPELIEELTAPADISYYIQRLTR